MAQLSVQRWYLNKLVSISMLLMRLNSRKSFEWKLKVSIVIWLLSMTGSYVLANDFPTSARAEYVFACMSSKGQTQAILTKCSCMIDFIADQMGYREYLDVETVMQMRLMPGERTAVFKESEWAVQLISRFNELQVSAELECF